MNDNVDSVVGCCARCGREHADDLKCVDEWMEDELRPIQTKLYRYLDDEAIPHKVRDYIVNAGNELAEAMNAARDHCTPNSGALPRRDSDVGSSPLLGIKSKGE